MCFEGKNKRWKLPATLIELKQKVKIYYFNFFRFLNGLKFSSFPFIILIQKKKFLLNHRNNIKNLYR